jgi:hypothetical protein
MFLIINGYNLFCQFHKSMYIWYVIIGLNVAGKNKKINHTMPVLKNTAPPFYKLLTFSPVQKKVACFQQQKTINYKIFQQLPMLQATPPGGPPNLMQSYALLC